MILKWNNANSLNFKQIQPLTILINQLLFWNHKRQILLIGFLLPLTALFCQKYAYFHYASSSGAPFEKVSSVIQDEAGFIWIGSKNGLYRFDGQEYENFGLHLKSQNIHQLLTRNNQLFFVNDTGLHRIDNITEQPKLTEIIKGGLNQTDTLPFYPNDFIMVSNHVFWLSHSNHSVGYYDNGVYKTYHFSETPKQQHIELFEEDNGLIWALSPLDGLFQFDRLNDKFEKVRNISGGNTFLLDEDYLLIGDKDLKIYYSKNASELVLLRTIKLEDDLISAIHKDASGRYIIGTENGNLYLLAELNSRLKPIYGSSNPHRIQELDFGHIQEIHTTEDSVSANGLLWVSSDNGLWLLKHRYFETVLNLPKNNPNSIGIGSNQKTWVSINGLYEIKAQNQLFQAQKIGGNNLVDAIALDGSDELWLSTSSPKVELIKVVNKQYRKRYNFQNRGDGIFYIHADSKKNVWFCQAPLNQPIIGVAKIDAKGKVHYYQEDKGFSSRILVIKESKRGEIYAAGIGENSYLYQYDAAADRFHNLSQKLPFPSAINFEVHDIAIDHIGVVWLATTDGLLKYDSEKITWVQDENLGHEEIRAVAALPNGGIWIATATNGLVYYANNKSIHIGEASGLPSTINEYRCLAIDKAGRVWAGTAEGLVYSTQSNAILTPSNAPLIKDILVNQKAATINTNNYIRISDSDELSLRYTSFDYHVDNSHYQYRLLNRAEKSILIGNHPWQDNKDKTQLNFTDLEAGKYFLELRTKQDGGYQWSEPLEIKLDVLTPWYRQAWFFYPFCAIILGGLGYYLRYFILFRINKLQELLHFKHIQLEEKEAQLNKKIQEFDEHQQEYHITMSNVQMLELFIKAIPPKAGWNEIITAMGKAVDQSIDIAAFEIAFIENKELVHKGYSTKQKGGYTYRNKPFDAKSSLTSWAMANQKEVVINDFDKEHHLYIDKKEAYHFQSIVIIPFLKEKQSFALCTYSIGKQQFNDNEVIMLRILVKFILRSSI